MDKFIKVLKIISKVIIIIPMVIALVEKEWKELDKQNG